MRTFILSATALASMVSIPAFSHGNNGYGGSQNYGSVDASCRSDRRTARNVGGFLGALGGASAGRALAAAAVRPEGVILGTVVGLVVGSSIGNAAVDCSPRALYTQDNGRSYGEVHHGHQQSYQHPQVRYYDQGHNQPQAQVYQPPVYQPPVHQNPVQYQPDQYQQGQYQPDQYQPGQADHQFHQSQQVVAGEDWYQPSPQSYYGQERRGPLVGAPSAYGRPDYVPTDSYVATQQQQTVTVTQTYHAGSAQHQQGYVQNGYAQQGGTVVVAPPGAACGYQICR